MPVTICARVFVARFVLASLALVLPTAAAILVPAIAAAQGPGESTSSSWVFSDPYTSACAEHSGPAPRSTATCAPTTFEGGTASASTSSTNGTRTITAATSFMQTGPMPQTNPVARGLSFQSSALAVMGIPGVGDQLIFHFLTSQSATGSGGNFYGDAFWELYLKGGSSGAEAEAAQNGYGGGTQGPLQLHHARATDGGFDLILPFTGGSTFSYLFYLDAEVGESAQQPNGATLNASMVAQLQGIDAATSQGGYISSATFDAQTGLGAINLAITTPEPGSMALFGTGLVGLVPVICRKRRSVRVS